MPESKSPQLDSCLMVELDCRSDARGSLAVIENRNLSFAIQRVFYIYDIFGNRGGHAHKRCHQFLVCLKGAVTVNANDGRDSRSFRLDSPSRGVYVPPMIWAEEVDFAPGTILLVLASDPYDESDYYRNYSDFQAAWEDNANRFPLLPK